MTIGPPGCLVEKSVLLDHGRPSPLMPTSEMVTQGAALLAPAVPRGLYPYHLGSLPRTQPTGAPRSC